LKPEKRYWDSSVIIAYINEERDRVDTCKAILDAAEQGKIRIYTSALTITEVLKYKGAKPIPKDKKQILKDFFQNHYVTVVQVDRWIAFDAQELVWDKGIPPKDSIHVASAIRAKVDVMESYDGDDLTSKSGTVGSPPLEIREPKYAQLSLKLVFGRKEEQEEDEAESPQETE
jgi:predicted nucleic acid-binding protein